MIDSSSPTLLVPHKSRRSTGSWGLPADLMEKARGRLRAMALLYAVIFFFAGFFPSMILADDRVMFFALVENWVPGVASIAAALAVAAVAGSNRLGGGGFFALVVTFAVASSYGIAAAEFLQSVPLMIGPPWIGLSWVAPWVLIFTVVVPSTPIRSVATSLASVSAVPVMIAIAQRMQTPAVGSTTPGQFFFAFVFPYVLIVVMAYAGARVIASLGHEVRKARELGSYQLITLLGRGGMGEVWRAKHRLLARPAAVKLIRPPEHADISESARRRFEREAQAIANLRSPHTVNLFDFGVAEDGTFYYVMELLDGLDTDSFVRRFGPLPAERVVFVLKQICHSLSEAESIGIVHRDIKPANIVLCRYGEDHDFVKVVDFGIAKAITDPDTATRPATAITAEHSIQGTPAFMAPEQALGGTGLDGRVDIYSTGCVAYWLLTGELVFTADSPLRLLLHHANTTPEPPSTRTEMPIPSALDALIMECLAKDPAKRPQTARELARRLDAIALDQAWTDAKAREWWTMHQPQTEVLRS